MSKKLVDQRYQRKEIVNLITVFYGDILLSILVPGIFMRKFHRYNCILKLTTLVFIYRD